MHGIIDRKENKPSWGNNPAAKPNQNWYIRLKECLSELKRQHELERVFRTNGIDPDIQSLRSTSRAYKVLRQRERDNEYSLAFRNGFKYTGYIGGDDCENDISGY